jgi:DNA-binding transcriptional ArsR family regulator
MEKKITLDRKTFKALAADTRIEILKRLGEHQQTLTDLAEEFDMAPSTIKEHLDKLVQAGLIQQVEKGMKWKYYKLTRKGRKLLDPYETKVWIILGTTIIALFGSLYKLLLDLGKLAQNSAIVVMQESAVGSREKIYEVAKEKTVDEVRRLAQEEGVTTTIITPITTTKEIAPQIPYLPELVLVIVLVLIAGICVGYLVKRRRII